MRLPIALCLAASVAAAPAMAQTAPPPPTGPNGMPLQEWQGVSCLWGGVIAGAGVFYYSDVLTVAATGAVNPLLLVPLVATGFVAGCSVGANSAPGLTWLYRKM